MENSVQFVSKKSADFHKEYPTISPAFLHEIAIDIVKLTLNQLDGSLNNDMANKLLLSMNKLIHSNDETKKQLEHNQAFINAEYKNQLHSLNNQKMDEIKKAIDETIFNKTNSIISVKDIKMEETLTQISALVNKLENPTHKGKISENILYNTLLKYYTSAEIELVANVKETCDIKIRRYNKPIIIIENKNYNRNVPQDEVKKFMRDTEIQNCCGIFLSQNTGICNKDHFQIDIHNSNILIYVHNANNDAQHVITAIKIIDHIKNTLDTLNINKENISVDKYTLEDINKEFQQVIQQKHVLTKCLKDFQGKMQKEIDEIKLPSLHDLLAKFFAFSVDGIICKYCNKPLKNQSALSAHLRGSGECATKKQLEDQQIHTSSNQSSNTDLTNDVSVTEQPITEIIADENNQHCKKSKKKNSTPT